MNYETRTLLALLTPAEKNALRAAVRAENPGSGQAAANVLSLAFSSDLRCVLWGRIYAVAVADWLRSVDWLAVWLELKGGAR